MKLIIQGGRIAATATDAYAGPGEYIAAPDDFDVTRLSEYVYAEGVLTLAVATRLTRLAFRGRFTQTEKVGLEMAALDDPTAPLLQRQQAAALRASLADMAAATYIDLSRADTRAGVEQLEAGGLLAPGRALEILDAPVQPEERPL
ncbi:hypothetical protein SAMN05216344_106134 [Polaromonas sp. OV174]|uniref:hypothetical protein n=1 Tax=Polaromonas sp. OV174 TaxID=1855300 RepID=UPI0008EA5299|nr:hypothetical protein [Polaromonas sp. OV174]SFB96906.1 hypothetical protein SAMN05216344_106134 [Polaromonas sp. OV174]